MKTLCIGGKNNITVSVIEYARTRLENVKIVAIIDKDDSGCDEWQRSVKKYCIEHEVPIVKLEDIYDIEDLIFISTEFDKIIRPERFRSKALFNIHFSLLPKYKGMFTSILPILNGDELTGVTLHVIRAGIDTGEIIDQYRIPIDINMNSFQLYEQLINAGTMIVEKNLQSLIDDNYKCYSQQAEGSSYYGRGFIDYTDLKLNTNCTANQIKNQINAFAFRPYQLLEYNGERLIGARITNKVSTVRPGTVICESRTVITMSTIDYDVLLYKDVLHELLDAIAAHDNTVARELCLYRPIVLEKEKHGWTPLSVAVYNNNFEMTKYLISIGADEKCINNNGTTLLMYAKDAGLRTGDWTIFRWLKGIGVSPFETDYSGRNIVDYLSEEQLTRVPKDITEMLKPLIKAS